MTEQELILPETRKYNPLNVAFKPMEEMHKPLKNTPTMDHIYNLLAQKYERFMN